MTATAPAEFMLDDEEAARRFGARWVFVWHPG
jgi:hypothetical protein